jgi:hypothetical protein
MIKMPEENDRDTLPSSKHFWNVGHLLQIYTAPHPKGRSSSDTSRHSTQE